jgi:hypothetical protein
MGGMKTNLTSSRLVIESIDVNAQPLRYMGDAVPLDVIHGTPTVRATLYLSDGSTVGMRPRLSDEESKELHGLLERIAARHMASFVEQIAKHSQDDCYAIES